MARSAEAGRSGTHFLQKDNGKTSGMVTQLAADFRNEFEEGEERLMETGPDRC
jgi:hypothetical protein